MASSHTLFMTASLDTTFQSMIHHYTFPSAAGTHRLSLLHHSWTKWSQCYFDASSTTCLARLYCIGFSTLTGKTKQTKPWARFTKYLTTILRLSYDNAIVTIDLRQTYNLSNILGKMKS